MSNFSGALHTQINQYVALKSISTSYLLQLVRRTFWETLPKANRFKI